MAPPSKKKDDDQDILDSVLYTHERIEAFQRIFGKTFISPGGEVSTERFCKELPLRPDCK